MLDRMLAGMTMLGTRFETTNPDQVFALPPAFVIQNTEKGSPTRILYRSCQFPVLDHAFDIQILHNKTGRVVFDSQFCRFLMNEVAPAAGDGFVEYRYSVFLLRTAAGTRFGTGQFLLLDR